MSFEQLIQAIRDNNTAEVTRLVEADKSIVTRYILLRNDDLADGRLPLMIAVESGHVEIVKIFIDAGADINEAECMFFPYDGGDTPIICASEHGHTEIVRELITLGADVDKEDEKGNTALICAAKNGHTEIVQALIAAGANVDQTNARGYHAMNYAAGYGDTDIVQLLIATGADFNYCRALNTACRGDQLETVRVIIEAYHEGKSRARVGAYEDLSGLEARDKNDFTPLMHAARNGNAEIVRMLLEAGVNPDATADIDDREQTALDIARQTGHTEVVELLEAATDQTPDTELILSLIVGDDRKMRFLIDNGADVNEKNGYEQTALLVAVRKGDVDIVQRLIDAGAEVNLADGIGCTPLMYAVQNGDLGLVEMLLQAGATNDAKNGAGKTALDLAREKGYEDVADRIAEKIREAAATSPSPGVG